MVSKPIFRSCNALIVPVPRPLMTELFFVVRSNWLPLCNVKVKRIWQRLLSGSGVMGSRLVVNRPREAESLGVGPDRAVDPLVALGAEETESHGGPDQVGEPARRGEVL